MSADLPLSPPRYSNRPLPTYAYVPKLTPHPVSDPRGHMYGHDPPAVRPLDAAEWHRCEPYLYGLDLFNHGYYWEAHEAWESLWHAAGRRGPGAVWLKALIKLAAAAVKLREGNFRGARRHADRALELLEEFAHVAADVGEDSTRTSPGSDDGGARYCGLPLADVRAIARTLREAPDLAATPPSVQTRFGVRLRLTREELPEVRSDSQDGSW